MPTQDELNQLEKLENEIFLRSNGGISGVGNDKKLSNPKDKIATTRLDMTLVPASAIAYCALAFTEGDLKYGGYNWRVAGVSANTYVAALCRHILKWYNGQEDDPKTLVPHLANAIACVAVLIDAIVCNKLVDDRPPSGPIAELLEEFEKKVKHLQELFPNGPGRYTEVNKLGDQGEGYEKSIPY